MREYASLFSRVISIFLIALIYASTEVSVAGAISSTSRTIVHTIVRGAVGPDTYCPQSLLINQGLLAPDSATGYFGVLAEHAVQRFQSSHHTTSSGDSISTGYGSVGALMRAALVSAPACSAVVNLAAGPSSPVYGGQIFVTPTMSISSAILKPVIADLQMYLKQIVGVSYCVGPNIGGPGIVLVLASSPEAPQDAVSALKGQQDPDTFYIKADKTNLTIVANDLHGLSNGVYYYLEQLGVRFLLSGPNWTVVPKKSDIRLSLNKLVAPAFLARKYSGTGGFATWRWGWAWGNSENGGVSFRDSVTAWQRRLRFGGQNLGYHTGEAYITNNVTLLKAHPEYLAKVGGIYLPLYNSRGKLNVEAKINAGNPDAVNAYCNAQLNLFGARQSGVKASYSKFMSVEPSDGSGYGDNIAELKTQGVGNGSPSDQTFYIANQCAKILKAVYPQASVVLLAYAGHAKPPSFALESNVVVQLTPNAFQNEPIAKYMADWKAKNPSAVVIYDYWSIPDWSHNLPDFNYLTLQEKLQNWHSNKIKGVNVESTYSAGSMGIAHYLSAHLMWDLDQSESSILDNWYTQAFGPAKAPMKKMLERWATSFTLTSAELSLSWQNINEAESLAADSPSIVARVDDFARYVRYLQLNFELQQAPKAEKSQKAIDLVTYAFGINSSEMVQTNRIFELNAVKYPALVTAFDLTNPKSPGPSWADVHDLSRADILALIKTAIHTPSGPEYTKKIFTGPLVPLKPLFWRVPLSASQWGTIMPTVGNTDVNVQIPPGLNALHLRVSEAVDNHISVTDDAGKSIFSATISASATGTRAQNLVPIRELIIPLTPGHYVLHFMPTGGRARGFVNFQTWTNTPITFTKFQSPKGSGASPRLYFYVPCGTQNITFYYPLTAAAGGPLPLVKDSSGALVTLITVDKGKVLQAKVGAGLDGKIWSIYKSISPNGPMEMFTTPQTFSLSPDTLLVPSDALSGTCKQNCPYPVDQCPHALHWDGMKGFVLGIEPPCELQQPVTGAESHG